LKNLTKQDMAEKIKRIMAANSTTIEFLKIDFENTPESFHFTEKGHDELSDTETEKLNEMFEEVINDWSIAEQIYLINSWEIMLLSAADEANTTDDDYDNETTIYYFSDGSKLKVDGIGYERKIL